MTRRILHANADYRQHAFTAGARNAAPVDKLSATDHEAAMLTRVERVQIVVASRQVVA